VSRRSKKALFFGIVCVFPAAAVLVIGLIPMLAPSKKPRIAGQLYFPQERPAIVQGTDDTQILRSDSGFRFSSDWLEGSYDKLMTWDRNPWKTQPIGFGTHYFRLLASDQAADLEKLRNIRRVADDLLVKLLARYPEFAISNRNLPPERNGFLKWLELSERIDADPNRKGSGRGKSIVFPTTIRNHLDGNGPWNPESVRSWLASEKPLIDEIRNSGLMPEQSNAGIDVRRWSYMPVGFATSCCNALLLEARISAGDGDVPSALESVTAAMGIARHLGNVEAPSLMALTGQIQIEKRIQQYSLAEILPAIPSEQRDLETWEKVIIPETAGPSQLTTAIKGEWHLTMREYFLPMIANVEDPKYPPDPEALLDAYSAPYLKAVQDFEGRALADFRTLPEIGATDHGKLSHNSRQLMVVFWVNIPAWSKGWIKHQSTTAMTRAAFSIMKGQTVASDPVHGTSYRWDPSTRRLSLPEEPAFEKIAPIIVPGP
jgi:hypothetical protein